MKYCEITLNIIKPTTQNGGIIQNCCEVLVWECICWVLKLLWAECSQNESFLVAESCFILSIPRGPTAYRAYSWRVCSSQKEHRQHQVWTQRNQVVQKNVFLRLKKTKTKNKHATGWRQLCAACILNILHAKDRTVYHPKNHNADPTRTAQKQRMYLRLPKSDTVHIYLYVNICCILSHLSFLFSLHVYTNKTYWQESASITGSSPLGPVWIITCQLSL